MYEAVAAYPAGDSTVSRQARTAADYGYDGLVVRTREAEFDADAISDRYGIEVVRGIEVDAADSEVDLLESTVDDLRAAGYDYVLIEGYHDAPYPKLVVGDRPAAPPIIARGPPAAFDVSALATAMIEGTLVDVDSA